MGLAHRYKYGFSQTRVDFYQRHKYRYQKLRQERHKNTLRFGQYSSERVGKILDRLQLIGAKGAIMSLMLMTSALCF